MIVISLVACRNLFCWGWWRGLRPCYTLKLNACQRLIVGWNLEYLQYRQGQGPGQEGGWILAHRQARQWRSSSRFFGDSSPIFNVNTSPACLCNGLPKRSQEIILSSALWLDLSRASPLEWQLFRCAVQRGFRAVATRELCANKLHSLTAVSVL